jgi:hypothetical protein
LLVNVLELDYKTEVGIPEEKRPLGRHRHRCENNEIFKFVAIWPSSSLTLYTFLDNLNTYQFLKNNSAPCRCTVG